MKQDLRPPRRGGTSPSCFRAHPCPLLGSTMDLPSSGNSNPNAFEFALMLITFIPLLFLSLSSCSAVFYALRLFRSRPGLMFRGLEHLRTCLAHSFSCVSAIPHTTTISHSLAHSIRIYPAFLISRPSDVRDRPQATQLYHNAYRNSSHS